MTEAWLTDAADLLAEPDPGPTPWLVEGLIVDRAITAAVGRWKTTKSYALLDVCVSVATGEPAFGGLRVPVPGPVVYACEESGRAALHRRLDAICRGRAIDPERLRGLLFVAANARVKLDDEAWQEELISTASELAARLAVFDPLARMKAAAREENAQKEMAVVIEFLMRFRDETNTAPLFVHHVGHQGEHMRGSSDLETAWETKLTWEREGQSPEVTVRSDHREAESSAPIRYRISWDHETRSMRFPLIEGDTESRVRAYLVEHPDASANEVFETLGGKRRQVLDLVKKVRQEASTSPGYCPGTSSAGATQEAGTSGPPPFLRKGEDGYRADALHARTGTAGVNGSVPDREAVPAVPESPTVAGTEGHEGHDPELDPDEVERLAALAREYQS